MEVVPVEDKAAERWMRWFIRVQPRFGSHSKQIVSANLKAAEVQGEGWKECGLGLWIDYVGWWERTVIVDPK